MSKCYTKAHYSLTTDAWTPITAPIDCNTFWVENVDADNCQECTDEIPGAGCTWGTLSNGTVLSYLPFRPIAGGKQVRFECGELITNLRAHSAPSKAVVTFIL